MIRIRVIRVIRGQSLRAVRDLRGDTRAPGSTGVPRVYAPPVLGGGLPAPGLAKGGSGAQVPAAVSRCGGYEHEKRDYRGD